MGEGVWPRIVHVTVSIHRQLEVWLDLWAWQERSPWELKCVLSGREQLMGVVI